MSSQTQSTNGGVPLGSGNPLVQSDHEKAVQALIDRQGGDVWGEDVSFPRTSWVDEVIQGDTQLGYWPWVLKRHEEECV